jgi:hypothetical protein
MKGYDPEVGQALFGQPYKEYECPEWLEAFLWHIEKELSRVMWNTTGGRYDSPFGNAGESFKNDVFEVHSYDWNEENEQGYNFKWGDVEISWYKYCGRGMSVNQEVGLDKGEKMLSECLESLRKMEDEYFEREGIEL